MKQFEVMRQAQARAAAITFFIVAFGIVGRGLSAAPVVVVESAAMTAEQSLPRESTGPEHGLLIVDGEKLEFEIYYGAIPAGHASLEVQSDRTEDGEIYRITSAARSNDAVSLFFDVDDRAVSEVDAATHEPIRFEKHISEGSFKKHVSVSYGDNGVVTAGDETFRVEPGTRDLLSALYYVRGQDLQVGEDVIVRTFENGKCYQARVRVLRREKVSTRCGDYQCLVVEPLIDVGVFAKTGRLLIYLTDDALKLPVLLKSKVKVGSFVAELVGRTHLGG
ncbi:MAG: DUF3108 domain-containing protein [Candidatus Eisenbacteria bacterium]